MTRNDEAKLRGFMEELYEIEKVAGPLPSTFNPAFRSEGVSATPGGLGGAIGRTAGYSREGFKAMGRGIKGAITGTASAAGGFMGNLRGAYHAASLPGAKAVQEAQAPRTGLAAVGEAAQGLGHRASQFFRTPGGMAAAGGGILAAGAGAAYLHHRNKQKRLAQQGQPMQQPQQQPQRPMPQQAQQPVQQGMIRR